MTNTNTNINDQSATPQPHGHGRTVVLVGHCTPDMFMLRSTVERALPGAAVATVNDAATLKQHLRADTILLINRVLDGSFASRSGLDLISDIIQMPDGPSLLLVSDLGDAQQQAEQLGAMPGFGKRELYDHQTLDKLRAVSST